MRNGAVGMPKIFRLICMFVLIAILGYFCYKYTQQEIVLASQNKQITQMREENQRLEDEYREMLNSLDDKNTLEYVEKYMRSHFGMVRNGEIRVDIVEAE